MWLTHEEVYRQRSVLKDISNNTGLIYFFINMYARNNEKPNGYRINEIRMESNNIG